MSRRRLPDARTRLSGLVSAAILLCAPLAAHAGDVWLAGVDAVNAADRQRLGQSASGSNDFMDLFKPGAPWNKAAASIKIFKVSQRFLDASTDEQLKTVIDDLHRRHIALGMSAQIMVASRQCGNGLPGSSSRASVQLAADRVKRLGGTIDYVAFDSPVAFGHFNILNKPGACNYSLPDLVRNITPQIQTLRAAFPDIKFGDMEPVNSHTDGWLDAYLAFAQEFKAQTGAPLSFLQADIIWFDNWRPQLVEWKRRLGPAGIAYGVNFDGSGIDKSDAAWTNHAIDRYRTVMRDPAIAPDDAVFQSWNDYPTHFLPQGRPGTLTWVVTQTVGVGAR